MSWLDELDPAVARLVLDGGEALAAFLWGKIRGDDTSESQAAIAAIRKRAVDAALRAAIAETQALATGVEFGVAFGELAEGARDVVAAMERAARSETVPVIDNEHIETEVIEK